jgi:hypothetical protein
MMRAGEQTERSTSSSRTPASTTHAKPDYKLAAHDGLRTRGIVIMGTSSVPVAIALVQAMYGIYNSGSISNL